MAVENRGGANGGPQYSPNNVSGTGGAGQSGRVASGYAYGMNKQINEQAAGAPMAKAPSFNAGSARMGEMRSMNVAPQLPPVTPITDPTMNPDESVMAGVNMGGGPGAEALMLPSMNDSAAEFNKSISSYYPVLSYIASRPNTSPETRRALAILMNEV
jgi:hypothetical protein